MPLTTNEAVGRQPHFIAAVSADTPPARFELLHGLQAESPFIAPKFFYDGLGARLFDAITALPEYYLPRVEAAIFEAHAAQMAALLPARHTLVDLGAGSCAKAARLLGIFRSRRYVAVDISTEFLHESMLALQRRYPALDMVGVGMDFSSSFVLPSGLGDDAECRPVLFYPGSSIGNFTPAEALRFLGQLRAACSGGGLLIGVDLVKPTAILEAAYDDPLGVTAAFNRNLLLHVNRLTDTNFALADWRHVAFFNEAESRIEMHLEARSAVTVRWPTGERRFRAGERIHTEHSYKWRPADFSRLLRDAGFTEQTVWQDGKGWFAVFWAAA